MQSHFAVQILKDILNSKEEMGDRMKDSFFSMTEAKYAAGDKVKHTIFDNVDTPQARHSTAITRSLLSVARPHGVIMRHIHGRC